MSKRRAATAVLAAVALAGCDVPTKAEFASGIWAGLAVDLPAGTVIEVVDPGSGEGDFDHAYVHAGVALTASADGVPVKGPFAGLALRRGERRSGLRVVALFQRNFGACAPERRWCVIGIDVER
jgi:hypothetical protein